MIHPNLIDLMTDTFSPDDFECDEEECAELGVDPPRPSFRDAYFDSSDLRSTVLCAACLKELGEVTFNITLSQE